MNGRARARAGSTGPEPQKRLLGVVSQAVEDVFASVETLRASMVSLAERAVASGKPLRRSDLEALGPDVAEVLARHADLVAGSGVVVAPDVIEDAQLWIEWWWLNDDAQPEPLLVDLDPESAEFYDYTTTEWYRVPERTGRRHVAGPYVDYICTHEYTFTLAAPVILGGRFLGIAGADILASQVERLVLPALARLPRVAALASRSGRVISSNSTQLMPGTIVRREAAGIGLQPVIESEHERPLGALPWVLLETPVPVTPAPEPPPHTSPL
jgi:hypothetical protein